MKKLLIFLLVKANVWGVLHGGGGYRSKKLLKVVNVYAWWHDAQIMGFWTGKHSRQPLKQGMTLEEPVKERGIVLMRTVNNFRSRKAARTQTDVELPLPEGGN